MTRLVILSAHLLFFYTVAGQAIDATSKQIISGRIIKGDSVKMFIDSMKISIFNDTLKFNPNNLVHINGRTETTNSSSLLFSVDLKYYYRLDIINGTMVSAFANQILDASKIERINLLDKKESMRIFGAVGNNGCVIISTKPKATFNFKVAGLKYNKNRKTGNNFLQTPKNQPYIMLRA